MASEKNGVCNCVRIDDVGSILKFRIGFAFTENSARFCKSTWLPAPILNFRIGSISSIGGLIAATLFAATVSASQRNNFGIVVISKLGSTLTPWSGPFGDHGLRPWSQSPSEHCKPYALRLERPFFDLVSQAPLPRSRGRSLFADVMAEKQLADRGSWLEKLLLMPEYEARFLSILSSSLPMKENPALHLL